MQISIHVALKALAVLSMLLVGACAGGGSHMRDVAPEKAIYAAKSDKALGCVHATVENGICESFICV
jgi:hypothetical protein